MESFLVLQYLYNFLSCVSYCTDRQGKLKYCWAIASLRLGTFHLYKPFCRYSFDKLFILIYIFFVAVVEEVFALHYGKGNMYLPWRGNKTHLSQMSQQQKQVSQMFKTFLKPTLISASKIEWNSILHISRLSLDYSAGVFLLLFNKYWQEIKKYNKITHK